MFAFVSLVPMQVDVLIEPGTHSSESASESVSLCILTHHPKSDSYWSKTENEFELGLNLEMNLNWD